MDTLDNSLIYALDHRTVAEIQRKVIKQSGRNAVSRLVHAANDKETIAAWKLDLNRILHVFNVRCATFVYGIATTNRPPPDRACNKHKRSRFRYSP